MSKDKLTDEFNYKNILIIYAGYIIGVVTAIASIKEKCPQATISLLTDSRSRKYLFEKNIPVNEIISYGRKNFIKEIYQVIKKLREKRYDFVIIPTKELKETGLKDISYIGIGVILWLSGIKNIAYYSKEYNRFDINLKRLAVLSVWDIITALVAPLIIFVRTPFFIWKEIVKNFILSKESEDDEFVGFGEGRGATGLIYSLTRAKMAKKYGLFGIAHDDYMGTPITLHRGFIDLALLKKFGFRKSVGISVILFVIAFTWLILSTTVNPFLLIILPFIFCSPYFIKHIYAGVLEMLSWSFFALSFVSYYNGYVLLAAIFFALLIFSHVGVGLLYGLFIFLYVVTNIAYGASAIPHFFEFLIFSCLTIFFTVLYLIPFIKSRAKLSRNELINKHYGGTYWGKQNIIQAIAYSIFFISALLFIPITPIHYLLLLPLLVLYINISKKWIFSAYTVEMFMLVTGIIFILLNPKLGVIVPYLYLINTSPSILVPYIQGAAKYKFSLKPVTLGIKKQEIVNLFKVTKGSRIALEGGAIEGTSAYQFNAVLSYLLVDEDVELLNGYGPEFVESSIYLDIVRYLDCKSSKELLKKVLLKTGTNYIVAYDEKFKQNLRNFGFKELGTVDCKDISWAKGESGPVITLFESPFDARIIEPETKLITSTNMIKFSAKKDVTYFLKYNYYKGWKAYQNKKNVIIEDAHPGMIIKAPQDGEIVLKYRYWHYWM
ncbi:hypothetical protein CW713_03115 [Methanophagales archaeon]|nr:MAG: hypothetical protein CW713_03115 [Methanophagales archaeon]